MTQAPGDSLLLVDTIKGSRFANLKELRIQRQGKPLRAFFAFDPLRQAIVLCAGNKGGNDKLFYKEMLPVAETKYAKHLSELEVG
ncbi:MAG: type II toxin-antitoxin system RelE/ParE family toxin [Aeromonas sp.]